MNRTIVRTSLFWLGLFAFVAAVYVYRTRPTVHPSRAPTGVQPIASGPMADMSKNEAENIPIPPARMDAPLVPVQLTNEQMNSIGVKIGIVEYKQLSDEIRATGTVDVDERLQSSVQVRFSGYIRKVFANATYQYVRKGDPLFTIYSPDLVATQEEYLLARRNQTALIGSSVDGVATGASSLTNAAEQRLRQWVGHSCIDHLDHHWRDVLTGAVTFDERNDRLIGHVERKVSVDCDLLAAFGHLDVLVHVVHLRKTWLTWLVWAKLTF